MPRVLCEAIIYAFGTHPYFLGARQLPDARRSWDSHFGKGMASAMPKQQPTSTALAAEVELKVNRRTVRGPRRAVALFLLSAHAECRRSRECSRHAPAGENG